MEIYVFSNDINVGKLTYENGTYVLTANEAGLAEDAKKGGWAKLTLLFDAPQKKSKDLFEFFDKYLQFMSPEKEEQFNILPTDNDFEKLCKIADYTPNFEMFYIRTTPNNN